MHFMMGQQSDIFISYRSLYSAISALRAVAAAYSSSAYSSILFETPRRGHSEAALPSSAAFLILVPEFSNYFSFISSSSILSSFSLLSSIYLNYFSLILYNPPLLILFSFLPSYNLFHLHCASSLHPFSPINIVVIYKYMSGLVKVVRSFLFYSSFSTFFPYSFSLFLSSPLFTISALITTFPLSFRRTTVYLFYILFFLSFFFFLLFLFFYSHLISDRPSL